MDYSKKFYNLLKDSIQDETCHLPVMTIDKWKMWDVVTDFIDKKEYYQCGRFLEIQSHLEIDFYLDEKQMHSWPLTHLIISCMCYRKVGKKKYASLLAETIYEKLKYKINSSDLWKKERRIHEYNAVDISETLAVADLCMFFDKELANVHYENLKKIQNRLDEKDKTYLMDSLGHVYGYDGALQQFADFVKRCFSIEYNDCSPYLNESIDLKILVLTDIIDRTETI